MRLDRALRHATLGDLISKSRFEELAQRISEREHLPIDRARRIAYVIGVHKYGTEGMRQRAAAGRRAHKAADDEDRVYRAIGFRDECMLCAKHLQEGEELCADCVERLLSEFDFEIGDGLGDYEPLVGADEASIGKMWRDAGDGMLVLRNSDDDKRGESTMDIRKALSRSGSIGDSQGTLRVPLRGKIPEGTLQRIFELPEVARTAVADVRLGASCPPGRSREAAAAFEIATSFGIEFTDGR